MKNIILITAAALVVSACAQKTAYEVSVEDMEPTYCYQSIGGVTCYAEPYHRDERRLVNYYGPAPIRYDRPDAQPEPERSAPQQVDFWVKDPEPVPTISVKGNIADRPWLRRMTKAEQSAHELKGMEAFLQNIRHNASREPVASNRELQAQTF